MYFETFLEKKPITIKHKKLKILRMKILNKLL